jgi:hypothetical protein
MMGVAVEGSLRLLVQRIREEFEDMPGLRFTVLEAARFWALDPATCERVLAHLLATRYLARGVDGRYEHASMASSSHRSSAGGRRAGSHERMGFLEGSSTRGGC